MRKRATSDSRTRTCAAGGPTRTCVGCGRRDSQAAMSRLRLDACGNVVPAMLAATGRSAYVHERAECIRGLARSKALGKSLRTTVAKQARLELMQSLEVELAGTATPQMRYHDGTGADAQDSQDARK